MRDDYFFVENRYRRRINGKGNRIHTGNLRYVSYRSSEPDQNAKRRCDYLIVGVNTDELVESYKNKRPIVPLEERAEIVRSIKYVDEGDHHKYP